MLRCFHLHGSFTNADFVEVGCEPQDIDETPDNRTHTILPLSDAVAQMFNSDSQVQERLQGEGLLQGLTQHLVGRHENTSAPAGDHFSTHLEQDGGLNANSMGNFALSACASHAEHPVINAYPAIDVESSTLRQPQDIREAHQVEPHGGPAYTTGDAYMQRQPWDMLAFTNGNPIMQRQPCEEPVFSKQGFHVPQPQQQQPHRARARPKQPAGQAIRQQAGSFRAPRPSTGRASKSLPPPPQQAKDVGGFMGIFKTANDAPIDHSRMGMAQAAKLLGLEQPNEDILPEDFLPLVTCLPHDTPHSFGQVPACALQHDGACPSFVGAPDTEPDQQSAAWASKAVDSLEQIQCLGVNRADSAQAAPGAPPQTAPSAPPTHEGSRLPASSLGQPGHEPDSPADVSSPVQGNGDFVGSAGIAMSPWCDSQLWALASCPQAAQGGQQHGSAQDLPSEPAQDAQVDGDQGLPREAAASAIEMQDASQHPGSAGQRGTMSGAPVINSPTQQETPDAAGRGSSFEQHVKPVEAESAQNVPPPAASTILDALAGSTHAADSHAAAHESVSRQGSRHPSEPQSEPCETANESAAPGVLVKAATEAHHSAEHAHAERGAVPATLLEEGCPEPQESVPAGPSLEHADAQQRSIPATLAEALDKNEQRGGVASDSGARMPEEDISPTEQAILLRSHEVPAPPTLQATIEELCPTVAGGEDVHEGVRLTQQGSDPAESLQAEGLRNGAAATSAPVELASMWSTASGGALKVSAEAMRTAQALLRTTPEVVPGKIFHAPPPPAEGLLPLPESGGPPLLSAASDLPSHTLGVKMKAAAAPCGNDISPAWRPPPAAAEAQGQLFTGSSAPVWGTASGKPVHFSWEKVAAAAGIFGDELPAALTPPSAGQLQPPPGGAPSLWGTASGKPLEISTDKMAAAAALFGNDFPKALTPPPEAQLQPPHGGALSLWGTASGKPLEISKDRMTAAAAMFGDEPLTALTPPPAAQLQPPHGSALSLWGTASGKPVEISRDRMAAAAAIFGDEAPTAFTPPPAAQLQPAHVIVPSLWGTASGNPLEISTDRMAAAAAMFGNDLPIALTPLPPAAADAMATIRWASVPAESSEACKEGVAVAEDVIEAAELHSIETMPPGSGPLQTLHGSHSKTAMTAAVGTPVLSTAEAGAALPWQTASGKRMRVSPEGLAAAASLLHRTPEPLCADTPQTAPPSGVQHGQADVSGSAVVAEPVHSAGEAASLDPGTPMQLQPAASLGQLSTGTTGRKRSSLLRPQQRPGPAHSKGKGGSCFKAPRKFETPVSKSALQQGCRNATPSRLQQSSTAAPRQPLHNLQGTLAGRLLAEAGYTGSGALADMCSHPDPAVASMSSRSAASYAVMDPSGGRAEAAAFAQLLHAAGVDTEYCSEAWVANHYRWIVWKLACYERRLPQQLAGRMLTLAVVLDQLKYRYEREYGRGQRSVLKKVLEQDERASRAMILCVAEVLRPSSSQQGGEEQVQLEVTDGWYSVSASIDGPLRHYLASGVLRTGTKLRVCGAELRGGQPETVLEASRSCSLHLHCNGIHRADADAKLGWTPYQSVVVPLSAIRLGGGTAPRTAVVVQRRFPALFWDTLSDGRSLRRTARAKAAADRLAEGQSEKGSEDAVAQIQAEERSHCRQLLAEAKSNNPVPDGAVLYANQILSGESLGELAQQATREDGTKADRYRAGRDAVMLKRREELMQSGPSVHVTRSNRLLPLLVSPLLPKGASGREQCSMRAIIEVSNPAEDVEALAEGCCCLVTDLSAPAKQRSTGPLLLRTSARTLWQLISPAEAQTAYSWEHEPRQRARLADILGGLPSPLFDFEGIVLGAGERLRTGGTGQAQQWLFLTDDSIDCFAQSPELACGPRIMAVQLQGQEEAVDFVSPALDVGSIASLRDLQLGVHDAANNLWRAHGTDHTAIQLQPVQSLSRTKALAGSASQRLAQWALSNQAFIAAMQAAVQRILST